MNTTVHRRTLLGQVLATALLGATGAAFAQSDRPIKFILPNATGSGVDAITRAAAPALGKALGTNVVVENQAGAGGVVGLQALTKNPPDGYTLSVVSNNVVIFPSVLKSLPFDMPGDFTPIAIVGSTPMVLVVNPNMSAPPTVRNSLLHSRPGPMPTTSARAATAPSCTWRPKCSLTRPVSRPATSRTKVWAPW